MTFCSGGSWSSRPDQGRELVDFILTNDGVVSHILHTSQLAKESHWRATFSKVIWRARPFSEII